MEAFDRLLVQKEKRPALPRAAASPFSCKLYTNFIMYPHLNTGSSEALPPSEWFVSYPVVERDQGMVEVEGYPEPITLDEYRAIKDSLLASRLGNGPAAQYVQEVA